MINSPPGYYGETRMSDTQWPGGPLKGSVETCVIGGGLAGLATALGLAERGASVTLLEASRIGSGASGRNGGFASAGYPLGMAQLARQLGAKAAATLWALSVEALALVRHRAEAMGAAVLHGHGALRCRMMGTADTLRAHVEWMNATLDAGLVYLPQAELRAMLDTKAYADAFLNPSSLQLHPLNFALGLAEAAAAKGADIREGVIVTALKRDGAGWQIVTSAGTLNARTVVLAGGATLGMLHRRLGLATVPVASFVMASEAAPERLRAVIKTPYAVSDTRVATDYYRLTPDGRLIWGGRANGWCYAPDVTRRLLIADMERIYPQLAGLRIESVWNGMMPIASHRMPIIAPLADGLWAAACFGGHGLVTTTLAGELIASALIENDERYRHFAPFGLRFAGGKLGIAAFQTIYWRHRFDDWRRRRHLVQGRAAMADHASS